MHTYVMPIIDGETLVEHEPESVIIISFNLQALHKIYTHARES